MHNKQVKKIHLLINKNNLYHKKHNSYINQNVKIQIQINKLKCKKNNYKNNKNKNKLYKKN